MILSFKDFLPRSCPHDDHAFTTDTKHTLKLVCWPNINWIQAEHHDSVLPSRRENCTNLPRILSHAFKNSFSLISQDRQQAMEKSSLEQTFFYLLFLFLEVEASLFLFWWEAKYVAENLVEWTQLPVDPTSKDFYTQMNDFQGGTTTMIRRGKSSWATWTRRRQSKAGAGRSSSVRMRSKCLLSWWCFENVSQHVSAFVSVFYMIYSHCREG